MTTTTSSRPVRAVLYDFDGTLADTTELIMRCYRHTMRTHLESVPSEEEWLAGFGTPLETQLARYARSTDEADAMRRTYRDYQDLHHDSMIRPFPGAVEAVAALAGRGLKLAIVTSKHRRSALRGMELCGLVEHFHEIVTPEDVSRPKPDPEPVRVALQRLGVEAAEALFVGDSPHDLAAGRAAGVRTAAVLWGPFPRPTLEREAPDHFLERQDAVLALVE